MYKRLQRMRKATNKNEQPPAANAQGSFKKPNVNKRQQRMRKAITCYDACSECARQLHAITPEHVYSLLRQPFGDTESLSSSLESLLVEDVTSCLFWHRHDRFHLSWRHRITTTGSFC